MYSKKIKNSLFSKKKANFGKLNLRQKAKICLPNRLYIYIYIDEYKINCLCASPNVISEENSIQDTLMKMFLLIMKNMILPYIGNW